MRAQEKKWERNLFLFLFRLLGEWPNTYAYTKAVAENVIEKQADDLPVGIFRPAIGSYIFILQYIYIENIFPRYL